MVVEDWDLGYVRSSWVRTWVVRQTRESSISLSILLDTANGKYAMLFWFATNVTSTPLFIFYSLARDYASSGCITVSGRPAA